MVLIVRYKGEVFRVVLEKTEQYLIHTLLLSKAKKFSIPRVNKGEFELWVNKNEVEALGDENELGLDGVLI